MSYKRRDFLKNATLLSTGIALTGLSSQLAGCKSAGTATANTGNNFGLQLYTLRDDLPKDPKGVLKQVADFGYKQIEGYEGPQGMFWGMSNTEFKRYLDDLGLTMVASHCNINENFERKAEEAAAIGMKYLISPYLGAKDNMEFYKQAARTFNERGETCKKVGMRFAYHNHDYSFKPVEGQLPQDVMMQMTSPDLVDYEMDIYWVVAAGQDPIEWFNKYPNRFKLCHVKDRLDVPLTEHDASTILGKGTIDFPKIIEAGKQKGLEYFIVEQEAYAGTTPIQSTKENAEYMRKLKI